MNAHIFVIDDDLELSASLKVLFNSANENHVRCFDSASQFVREFPHLTEPLSEPGCILLDIRMPDMTGYELFAFLQQHECTWPVIFMTGHGDLSMAVNLIKSGAFDYLTKPFDPMGMIEKVQQALALSQERMRTQNFKREHLRKMQSLSPHEWEVFTHIMQSQSNREIAEHLEKSVRTIESHRANILKKMGTSSALELAKLHERFTLSGGHFKDANLNTENQLPATDEALPDPSKREKTP
jgi:two-component system, LuxR family, response regulator DctR